MTRRGWHTTIILMAVLAGATAGVVAWWKSNTPVHTELDKAINQTGWRPNLDVTDVLVRHLPNDFNGAEKALRDFGFGGGTVYRRPALPDPNDANRSLKGSNRYYNRMMDEHDAVLMKTFERTIPGRFGGGRGVRTYLFLARDGSVKVSARLKSSKF